ncbi:exodeoxyribonuclease VII large subunit [compost metagenome]
MVINLISSKITNNAMTARADMEKINSLSMEKLSRARVLCENLEGKIKSESSKSIILSRKLIELQCQQVISSAKSRVAEAKEQVNSLIMRAITSDPSRVVSKGYAYILTDDGKVVGDGNNINPGDSFSIQMRDGRFKAVKV